MKISDINEDLVKGKKRTISIFNRELLWPFPITFCLHSSIAMVFGCPVFSERKSRVIWVLYKILCTISNVKYWLMYRFVRRHQYHIVRTGLKPKYYDIDTIMLHAMMSLLCRYVEDGNSNVPEDEKEIMDIYRWWKYQRPADQRREKELSKKLFPRDRVTFVKNDDLGMEVGELKFKEFETPEEKSDYTEFRDLQNKIADDETKMLHRLIDIRGCLWT